MERRVEDELASTLYRQAWAALFANLLLLLILTLLLSDTIPAKPLFTWSFINLIDNASFFFIVWQYHRNPKAHTSNTWINRYTAHSILHSLLWSAIGPLTLYYGSFEYQMFILFVFAGMAAGAIGSRGFMVKVFLATTVPMLTPLFLFLVSMDTSVYNVMAALVMIYFVFLLFIVKNYSQNTNRTIHLLIHNEALVNKLSQTNQELEDINNDLNREIKARMAVEKQLNVDKQRAEEVGLAKSRFIANMSHEFRTPLNAIIGFGELLKNSPLNERQQDQVGNIIISSNHLIDLVNDVLDISRIESGKITLDYQHLDVYALVDEVINITATSAINKGLVLIKDIQPITPRFVSIDRIRLKQILLNLVNNAIKFTRDGHVRLSTSYIQHDSTLCFQVSDSGIGIDPKDHNSLFHAFSQLENFEMKRQQGAGLGLTITRNLTDLMKGRIKVDSTPGKGSRFRVELPVEVLCGEEHKPELITRCYLHLADARLQDAMRHNLTVAGIRCIDREGLSSEAYILTEDDEEAASLGRAYHVDPAHIIPFKTLSLEQDYLTPFSSTRKIHSLFNQERISPQLQPTEEQGSRRLEDNTQPLKILVADDNRLNRLVIKNFLEDIPHVHILEAEDGAEVLNIVEAETKIDLILMDIQMPEVSGIEATQSIREIFNGDVTRVPIIAVTAHALPEYRSFIMSRGFNDCLVKPISQEQLLQVVQEWI